MPKLDVYYCTTCQDEFAVNEGKEPQYCPFCSNEVDYSNTIDEHN